MIAPAAVPNETRRLPRGVVPLAVAALFSTSGSLALTTALGKLVYDITHRKLDLGLLGLAEFLPTAVLAPLTGTLADRFDRRHVAALGWIGEALCMAYLAHYAGTHPHAVWPIYVAVVAFGITRAVVAPASRALPFDLVSGKQVSRVIALSNAGWQLGAVVGPVLAGFLYGAGIRLPFIAAAALVIGSALLMFLVPHVDHRRQSSDTSGRVLHEAMAGLRYVRRSSILLGAISLDLFAVLFGGAVALLPAIAEDRLHVGAVGLGWLRAATGIGAGLVTLTIAARPISRRVGRVLLLCVGLFGVFTIVLGVTHNYAVAFVALMLLSGADAVSVFIRATLVPLATPIEMRGRVLAVEQVFIGASNELGAFESGVAGQILGLVGAVVLGGAATLAVVALWWVLFPALRDVDRFSEFKVPVDR